MSSWYEERRRDEDARAARRRADSDADAERQRNERRKDRQEKRDDKAQRRRDRAARRQARAARRQRELTPATVYGKGTLALVGFSAAASLPAQVIHFVSLHWMLFPIGPAIEGLAWVMAAGVAYADEKKLPAWVRWLLRGLTLGAAGFAAHVNYTYGLSLTHDGLTAEQAATVGTGLAAVTLAGPVVFEIRQWVRTLTAKVANPKLAEAKAEAKARARHDRRQRRHHRAVVKLAQRLVSAAPYKKVDFDEALDQAWEIMYGTRDRGMTPALHGRRLASHADFTAAMDAANGSPVSVRGRLLELLHTPRREAPATAASPQVATDLSPLPTAAEKQPAKGPHRQPPQHRRSKGDALPFHPMAKGQHSVEARTRIATVNGHHS